MDEQIINKAIAAHSHWKARLNTGIATGGADLNPAVIGLDDQCEFGQWLAQYRPAAQHQSAYSKVKTLHSQFHHVAAKVARLVKEGQRGQAESMMKLGGEYMDASTKLVAALGDWKKSAGKNSDGKKAV